MKKILITSLIVLTCLTAFISCNAETSIGSSINKSVETVDVQQQSIIKVTGDLTSGVAYLITENGIDKYTIENNKVKGDPVNIVPNKALAQVATAFWNEDDKCIYYLTSGYDFTKSEPVTKFWKLDTKKAYDKENYPDESSTNPTIIKSTYADGLTFIEDPVFLSSTLNLYSKDMLDTPFLNDSKTGITEYNTCRFMLESEGSLLLSNAKHWYISPEGKYNSTKKEFEPLVDITGCINSSKLAEDPIVFKKIGTDDSTTKVTTYWVICDTYAYIIKIDSTGNIVDKDGKTIKTAANGTSETSPFSGTRMVTFENDNKVFLKYSADYSSIYSYNKDATSLKTVSNTYLLSKTLHIVDMEKIGTGDTWIAATLDSGLYLVKFDGSKFTATSMQTL